MPTQVNRVPPGLLSLLDIKSLGQNPSLLADEISPTLEMGDFYTNAIAQQELETTDPITGQGSFLCAGRFICQPGELLVVSSFTAIPTLALAAGNSLTYTPCVISIGLGRPIAQVGPTVSPAATQRAISGSVTPFIVTPGQTLGVYCTVWAAAANPTVTIFARVTRLTL